MFPPQHDSITHKCLFHNLVMGDAREYSQTIHILTPFFLSPMSFDTTLVFYVLHPQSYGFFPFF